MLEVELCLLISNGKYISPPRRGPGKWHSTLCLLMALWLCTCANSLKNDPLSSRVKGLVQQPLQYNATHVHHSDVFCHLHNHSNDYQNCVHKPDVNGLNRVKWHDEPDLDFIFCMILPKFKSWAIMLYLVVAVYIVYIVCFTVKEWLYWSWVWPAGHITVTTSQFFITALPN